MPTRLVRFTAYPIAEALDLLLADKTTRRNILFATNAYADGLSGINAATPIPEAFVLRTPPPICPRVAKSRTAQSERTRRNAEVFTPVWICNRMNNHLDTEWFGREHLFNREYRPDANDAPRWRATRNPIPFSDPDGWRRYVDSRRIEITCGEAPFIVSRYDAATGRPIPLKSRIGILDRKLRVVNENTTDETEWMRWTIRAFQSVYGFEYQGDNLLIARANLLITFAENVQARWNRPATRSELRKVANVIAWNFWQMDGTTDETQTCEEIESPFLPGLEAYAEREHTPIQQDLFGADWEERDPEPPPPCWSATKPCVIFDWRSRRPVIYRTIKKEEKTMKFDFAIGNPPYQEEAGGTCTSDKPIYHLFMDEAYKVADKVELITPARFLFNAGATPKAWNKKMLDDSHFKVLEHVQKSDQVFANTDIKGGVAVTYRDSAKEFGAIEAFTSYSELNSILKKVEKTSLGCLADIISNRGLYRFSEKAYREHPEELKKTSDSRISTNALDEMPKLFTEEHPQDGFEYFQVFGNLKGKRVYRWFRMDYCVSVENLLKYKVIIPKANGSGVLGEALSTPIIGTPMIGFTETYISVGSFGSKKVADSCLKYIKTKFARTMLGVLKITQDNTKPVWRKVPLQDFTSKSDIDWTGSVAEIDAQLYKKYGLSDDEIAFIEEKVQAME